ncbi:4-hydroxy-3-polyprenylbenzoate decarboxylase [Caldalkalibacillus uzonensis]|uniref:Flavin prenyltransferase UbiX n=1 Tax=Caldalkalibacillus uzonensis TaxID=353224 RepID=A0ABU0CXY2_9BACI|nr:UbiX family flavin prenyltransferase [Caldalkalibacillus uzonensis]MDQ0341014.1 4-hydroxy-3-polyprenylbenzoate decarboxylase [Caldalkalibacillus uzonensis]
MKKIVIGITGASGSIYGIRTIEALSHLQVETHVVISPSAIKTIVYETDYTLEQIASISTKVYEHNDIGASISSGSFIVDGMIIAPCSIKTLSSIANSFNDNLITRVADVTLKERRKLVLLLRETPLHLGHIKLMQSVTEMGGIILPPVPSFYHKPRTIDDIVNHSVGKALDQFGIEARLFERWKGLK